MLATRYFVEQLTGRTPVETLRIQAARTERIRLPTRFSGLAGLGVPEAVLAPLTALAASVRAFWSASFFFVRLRGIPSGRVKGCRNGLSAAAA